MITADASAAPIPASELTNWDWNADVVVVGGGSAGLSAAIEARRAGASVLVLEAAGGVGGSSALAGGLIYLGGGTPIQTACGFNDSSEQMLQFLLGAAGPGADREKVELYCRASVAHFEWLTECGVRFKPEFWSNLTLEPWNDAGLAYSGGELAHPWPEIALPAPRGHVPQVPGKQRGGGGPGGGQGLVDALLNTARQLGVQIELNTKARHLVVDSDGRVTGLVARRFGEPLHVGAAAAVVLASGSFSFDEDLVAAHAPAALSTHKIGVPQHDGHALRMALALGAAVRNMDAAEATTGLPPALYLPGIMVTRRGQRFINEDAYPGRIGQYALFRYDRDVLAVFDEEIYEAEPVFRDGFEPTWVTDTLAELEEAAGIPTDALQNTVEFYNRHAEQGQDPLYHKSSRWLKPLRPPFAAIDALERFRTFTLGGLHTTVDGEVLSVDGAPIRGLYAAGRVTSGLPARGYVSGLSLADCTYFGRRAGAAAAAATP